MTYLLSPHMAGIQRPQPQLNPIAFWGGNGGLVTAINEKLIALDDFKTLTNLRYENGLLRTREGLYQLTGAETGLTGGKYFKTIAVVPISGSTTILGVSDDYKLYKLTGAEASMSVNAAIATLSGNCQILPFAGSAVLCDTGYLKYYNGSSVNIAYDNGTGTRGYMFNHLTDSADSSTPLYTGSILSVGNQETTLAFGAGYTIPYTKIRVWLSKTGSPTGTIVARVWSSAGADWGASTTVLDVSTLSTNAAVFNFDFSLLVNVFSASTPYRYGLAFTSTSSDASNHPNVHYDTVASGGYGYTYTVAGGWVADATKNFLIGIKPGLPPKASFGAVADNRLHVVDPDYTGKLQISAPGGEAGGMLDWCTRTLAGYVNSVDDGANSFPIGAVVAKYGDIWIFGKASQPYLAKLTGSSPTDWIISLTGQEAYTDWKSIKDTIDDLFFASSINCHSITGTEQYGDVRSGGVGTPIKNLFESYWTTAAFSAYWGITGQFFIYLPTYGTMVCHTKDRLKRWTRYTFKNLTETALHGGANDKLYVACSNGHLYRLLAQSFTDAGTAYDITGESGKIKLPFGDCELIILSTGLNTAGTTTGKLSIYANNSSTVKHEISLSSATFPAEWKCGMNAHSLQIKLDTVAFTTTTYFEPIIISARKLYGLGQR